MNNSLTGTFGISEFVCQERLSEFSGDTEYSMDGEYWCESEAEAIEQFRVMNDPKNHNVIY